MKLIQTTFNEARINKQRYMDAMKAALGQTSFEQLLNKLRRLQASDPISRGKFHVVMNDMYELGFSMTEALAEELDFPEFTDEELATINRCEANMPPEIKKLMQLIDQLMGGK